MQDYINTVESALGDLAASSLPAEAKYEFFNSAYDHYGRTALCFSGGGALAFGHLGVVRALLDADMLPKIVTGSSAGCLAASLVATRTEDELRLLISADLKDYVNCMEASW